MILGHVRNYFPRVSLLLPGIRGPLTVEFIVDTGFEGAISLPTSLVQQLEIEYSTDRLLQMVDRSIIKSRSFLIHLDWNDEKRPTEVTVLENAPLLGAILMNDSHVDLDMRSGGEVVIEPY